MQPESDERKAAARKLNAVAEWMDSAILPASVVPALSLDLTVQQLKVLTVLAVSPDEVVEDDLSTLFGTSAVAMSNVLDRLVDQHVARHIRHTNGTLRKGAAATPLGRSVVRRLVAAPPDFNEAVLAGMSLPELRALERGMAAIGRELAWLRTPEATPSENRTKRRSPTIADVARAAGVSHTTVSRVLNEIHVVRPATRDKVFEAIASLGWRPDGAAADLARRRMPSP